MDHLIPQFIEMFSCDTARISSPCGKHFLIIGWKRQSKDDKHRWMRNGKPYDFEYIKEQCIASGRTEEELLNSASEYKRLQGMTMEEYINEQASVAAKNN